MVNREIAFISTQDEDKLRHSVGDKLRHFNFSRMGQTSTKFYVAKESEHRTFVGVQVNNLMQYFVILLDLDNLLSLNHQR